MTGVQTCALPISELKAAAGFEESEIRRKQADKNLGIWRNYAETLISDQDVRYAEGGAGRMSRLPPLDPALVSR